MNKRYKYQEVAERIKMVINPHTVACALRLLMEKGIIYTNERKG